MTGTATPQHTTGRHTAGQATAHDHHRPSQIAQPKQPQPRQPQRPHRTRPLSSTPGRVRAGTALVIVLAAVFAIVAAITSSTVTSGFGTIGGTNAPLVENSNSLYFAVNDMDAQVANVLLAGHSPSFAADRQAAVKQFATDRNTADNALRNVTAIAAANKRAQAEIGTFMDGLGQYEALAANAIELNTINNDPAGRPSSATRNSFEQATDLMTSKILPVAAQLTNTNHDSL